VPGAMRSCSPYMTGSKRSGIASTMSVRLNRIGHIPGLFAQVRGSLRGPILPVQGTAGAEPVRGREYFSDEYLALIFNEIDNWVPLASNVA